MAAYQMIITIIIDNTIKQVHFSNPFFPYDFRAFKHWYYRLNEVFRLVKKIYCVERGTPRTVFFLSD